MMGRRLYHWIRKALGIDEDWSRVTALLRTVDSEIAKLRQTIVERTTIDADLAVSARDVNTVIVIGRYHKADYVRVFQFHADCLEGIIRDLHQIERQEMGRLRRLDAPVAMRYVVDRMRRQP